MSSEVRRPEASGWARSPEALAPATVSTKTVDSRTTSSSASRMSGRKPPTRSTWVAGDNHDPWISGAVAPVAHEMMSATETAASRSATATAGKSLVARGRQRWPLRLRITAPHRHLVEIPLGGMGQGQVGGELTGTDDQQPFGVGTGQMAGGQRRNRGGPASGQGVAVDRGRRQPGRTVEQQVGGVDGGMFGGGIGREVGDDLDANRLVVDPTRHQQQGSDRAVELGDVVHMTIG